MLGYDPERKAWRLQRLGTNKIIFSRSAKFNEDVMVGKDPDESDDDNIEFREFFRERTHEEDERIESSDESTNEEREDAEVGEPGHEGIANECWEWGSSCAGSCTCC
jgi:hypothetical protein